MVYCGPACVWNILGESIVPSSVAGSGFIYISAVSLFTTTILSTCSFGRISCSNSNQLISLSSVKGLKKNIRAKSIIRAYIQYTLGLCKFLLLFEFTYECVFE